MSDGLKYFESVVSEHKLRDENRKLKLLLALFVQYSRELANDEGTFFPHLIECAKSYLPAKHKVTYRGEDVQPSAECLETLKSQEDDKE